MIEWDGADDHVRVVDADNTTLCVQGVGLTIDGTGPDISRPVDETIVVTAKALQFPHAVVYASALGRDEWYQLEPDEIELELPPAEYVLDIDTGIKTYLRFSGPAVIQRASDYSTLVISFPERTRTILGFRSRHEFPAETITVSETPSGLARGLSLLSSSIKTQLPDRTYPTLRGHPPLLETGETFSAPASLRNADRSGIELVVPPRYDALFVVAPLAYFLQATVSTESGSTPRIRLPDVARERELQPMPDLEADVERLLRQCFFLDCLVRNAGPYGTRLAELNLLEALDIDAKALYEATPQERLAAYLEVPYSALSHRLPTWHLSTYVEPTVPSVEAIPYLLDRLSLIFMPRTSTLEGRELVERSLTDFYRGDRSGAGQVASVNIVKPELRGGRVHGWLADGVPIDVFKSNVAAYRNRLSFLERDNGTPSIRIVLNDPEMAGERERVASIYQQRAEELSLDVRVDEHLRTDALAQVFESDHAFVHYIGHCETDGLRCPDGALATSSIDDCRVETFFLNACGSFYEGMNLIERGSVAGAVTFRQVLNDHALKVGSTFAKLLVHGFSFERAMRLARRRIMMGKDYAVVGDGTHSVTEGDLQVPTTATIEPLPDGNYLVELECYSTRVNGQYYYPHAADNEYSYLCGTPSSITLEKVALTQFLQESNLAVIYDGDVYWSSELARTMSGDQGPP
ncbi:hypothetical protein [Natronosalvus vescus]|uniref:hypothetical protein n=1 Tax=Natronosalvus vescus TaxID=2953881 RepID=UPI002091D82C|nr:hypothetical protein [Natronosalvus vescus]